MKIKLLTFSLGDSFGAIMQAYALSYTLRKMGHEVELFNLTWYRSFRQQVAVACCATKTGWPRMGVCFPSFGITAGASLFSMNSNAWDRTVSMPFSFT